MFTNNSTSNLYIQRNFNRIYEILKSTSIGSTGPTGATGSVVGLTGPIGPTGSTGIQGQAGQSSSLYPYKIDTTSILPPPISTFIRYNNSNQISSTNIYLSHLDLNNYDIENILSNLKQNDTVIIQDVSNSDNYQKFLVISTVITVSNSYINIPVSIITSNGTGALNFSNNQSVLFIAT
jgi:hypothetical protein